MQDWGRGEPTGVPHASGGGDVRHAQHVHPGHARASALRHGPRPLPHGSRATCGGHGMLDNVMVLVFMFAINVVFIQEVMFAMCLDYNFVYHLNMHSSGIHVHAHIPHL
jgi:hypothetical protein